MKRFIVFTSALRVRGLTGTTCSLILKYCDAFQNAAWAVDGMTLGLALLINEAHISGAETPLTARAQSRWALQDMRIDSVPPEVAAVSSWIQE
jgi:hypothetical protein